MDMPSEHSEQAEFIKYIRLRHPTLLFYAIPNGGYRNGRTAMTLKAEGVRKGIPDLCFPSLFLYIEMKRLKGSYCSDHQKAIIKRLESFGYKCYVCKGCQDAIEKLEYEVKACTRCITNEHE